MPPIYSITAALTALAGVGHTPPPHAAHRHPAHRHPGHRHPAHRHHHRAHHRPSHHAHSRLTKPVTFALPASHQHHRYPLVAVAYIRGHAVELSRPKVHGRHAVSQLTARALVKARIANTASRSRATARLFADGYEIAQTKFRVPAFGHSAPPRQPKTPASSVSTSPSTTPSPTTATGTGTGTTTIGTTGGGLTSTPALLTWAPPALTNPTTIYVKSGLDPDILKLSTSKDYILKMPAGVDTGTLEIDGGHNVVVIGGQITVPSTANQTDNGADDTDTGIYVKGSTGTVHIEGMLISGQANTMFDGIDINAPQATVQIENVRMTGLWGSYTSEHSDAIQTWGGVKVLRIDNFTADGDYQGLTLKPDMGSVGSGQFQNVDLTADPPPAALASRYTAGGIMLWLTAGTNTCTTTPMSFTNVYINNKTGSIPSGNTVWPSTTSTLPCRAQQTGNSVSWPGLSAIKGSVILGTPPTGSFVPAGTVGVGYQTRGYAAP
jgi:hypothetical protein